MDCMGGSDVRQYAPTGHGRATTNCDPPPVPSRLQGPSHQWPVGNVAEPAGVTLHDMERSQAAFAAWLFLQKVRGIPASGNDRIHGGSGDDQMWGKAFRDDVVIGEAGSDEIDGGSGNDLLVDPVGGGQSLSGGSGAHRVNGFGTLNGGSGDDTIRVLGAQWESSTLDGGSSSDTCTPFTGSDVLISCEDIP